MIAGDIRRQAAIAVQMLKSLANGINVAEESLFQLTVEHKKLLLDEDDEDDEGGPKTAEIVQSALGCLDGLTSRIRCVASQFDEINDHAELLAAGLRAGGVEVKPKGRRARQTTAPARAPGGSPDQRRGAG